MRSNAIKPGKRATYMTRKWERQGEQTPAQQREWGEVSIQQRTWENYHRKLEAAREDARVAKELEELELLRITRRMAWKLNSAL